MVNISKKITIIAIISLPIISLGLIFGLIGALIGLLASIILSIWFIITNVDRIIMYIYRAHHALPSESNEIRDKTRLLSERKGVREPSLYITELELPGSFIIGKNMDSTALIFPKRLIGILKNEELDALLAFNIVQINNSIRKRTIVALITGILTMSASAIRWGAVFMGFGDYDDPAPKLFSLFLMGLVAPPAATLIYSVSKEDIDSQAVNLCKDKNALISAIQHLEENNITGYPSLGYLCLVEPQKENFFESLFNMHESKESRMNKLAGQKA
jgi:heat shock protein HtpX